MKTTQVTVTGKDTTLYTDDRALSAGVKYYYRIQATAASPADNGVFSTPDCGWQRTNE